MTRQSTSTGIISRRTFLARAAGGAAAGLSCGGAACAGKLAPSTRRTPEPGTASMTHPNLVFLFTDEQRFDTLAAYGNARIEMPNLNRLARTSTVVERAYVTQPVCTPSRASLLTGLTPHTSGCTENNVPLPADIPTLAERLASGDYATGYFGKWHLGDEIFAQHGFAQWRSIEDGYHRYYSPGRDQAARSTYHQWLVAQGLSPKDGKRFSRNEAARLPEKFGKPAYLAQEASRFIRDHRGGPFCLFVNFLEPHMPFFGPRDDQYGPDDVTLPPNFNHPPTADQPLKARLFARAYRERGHGPYPLKTEGDWRTLISNYWGLCSLVDTHVGTILAALDEADLSDRTIVVYTSDHGDMMGSHRLLAKCVMFEEAVRVPLLVRLPGQREGRRLAGPLSQIDLVPTLLDLMGQPVPARLEGVSRRALLEGRSRVGRQTVAPPDDVFIEWNGPDSGVAADAIRRVELPDSVVGEVTPKEAAEAVTDPVRSIVTADGWKFNCSPRGDHELYDLNRDPIEVQNLAFLTEMQPTMAALLGRLRAWQQRTGDKVNLPDPPYTR